MVKTRLLKQARNAIKKATYNTQLSMNERYFYRWIETQDRHRHVFCLPIRHMGTIWNVSLQIDQKHKR
jgi:hypothetical protein